MKTHLSKFCEEFEALVRPVLAPLVSTAETLETTSADLGVREVLPQIHEARHRLTSLAEKVAEQQAYVLIFGPLKSGKSTLMNGIAAAYVSEVTALPAYPCMVYVSHAEEKRFTITRYNGQAESFSDVSSMQTLMELAHRELAHRLREVEAEGAEFDPLEHLPNAIRRVDVRLPAEDLKQSSAVLVDTPGLYSRMRFGYDRMTREFRDSAACAVFVVKTDNLFLEQVFFEFEELLGLFSRIFLVVNIDTTKQDLQADGKLGPSLENSDPGRIIEAFETLAMSAPLKKAADEGRLKIFPVDLLHSAAARLSEQEAGLDDARRCTSFEPFLNELTDYLNSTDYIVAFLGDSLRQAGQILDEVDDLEQAPQVLALEEQIHSLGRDKAHCLALTAALERLGRVKWNASFEQLGSDLRAITLGRIENLRDQTADKLSEALDHWAAKDSSFQALLSEHVHPIFEACRADLATTARGVFQTVGANDTAGAQLSDEQTQALALLEFKLGQIGSELIEAMDIEDCIGSMQSSVSPATIPLRRGLLDWILFRSQAKMRLRLFGSDRAPSKRIPANEKSRRLGEPGLLAINELLEDALDEFFKGALSSLMRVVLDDYMDGVRKGVLQLCHDRQAATDAQREILERKLSELSAARIQLNKLLNTSQVARGALLELGERYGAANPEELTLPIDLDEEVAEAPHELIPQAAPEPEFGALEGASEAELELESPQESPRGALAPGVPQDSEDSNELL